MPDGKVDSGASVPYATLGTGSQIGKPLFKKGNKTGVFNFATSYRRTKRSKPSNVKPDSCSLCSIVSHNLSTCEDGLEVIVGLDEHARRELFSSRSKSSKNWCCKREETV